MRQRAGFGPRLVALVIDGILLTTCSVMIGLMSASFFALLAHRMGIGADPHDPAAAQVATALVGIGSFLLVTALMSCLLSLPYNLMEAFFGWTPGKLAMGLRVCNEKGESASLGQVFLRWLIKHNAILVSMLAVVVPPVAAYGPIGQLLVFGGCFMALGPRQQALHDMATGTAVYLSAREEEADS